MAAKKQAGAPGFPDPKKTSVREAYLRLDRFYRMGEDAMNAIERRMGKLLIIGGIASVVIAGAGLLFFRSVLWILLAAAEFLLVFFTTQRSRKAVAQSKAAMLRDLNRMRAGEVDPMSLYRKLWDDYRNAGRTSEALGGAVDVNELTPEVIQMLQKYEKPTEKEDAQ